MLRATRLGELMINVFVLQNGRLSQANIETREDLEKTSPIWVDLTDPSDEERDHRLPIERKAEA